MTRLSCGTQCARWILFIMNLLCFVLALALLGFGIYVNVSKKLDVSLSEHINGRILGGDVAKWTGIAMMTIAIFIVVVAGCGCLGALLKNRVFLYLYSIILGLLIIGEMAILIVTINYRKDIRDSYYSGFREAFIDIYNDNNTDLEYIIEDIESEFQCCGVNNITDYYQHNFTVPTACYQDSDYNKPYYQQGCADAVIQWFWNQLPIIGSVLGGILLIEIFCLISSVALGIAISHTSYNKLDEY